MQVEATPDTVIFLSDGQKIVVREAPQLVVDRVIAYRRAIQEPTLAAHAERSR